MSFMPTLKATLMAMTRASGPRTIWSSLAAALILACLSQNSFALGLGEMQVSSVINEPLAATIPVLNAEGIEQAELIVALGSATDYQIAGVTWEFSHSELQFDVGYASNGELLIDVSSTRAIREPYLNFLVQARWPAGRLLREYTILLDFPVFTGEQDSAPTVAAAPVARASAPEPIAQATIPRPAPVTVQPNPVPRVVSGAPAGSNAQPLGDGDYRIQNGDTLWSLGGIVAQDLGVSRHQAMLAIREANPEAFTQGNLNMLRSGSVIRVPSRNAALSRSATQAAEEFAQAMSVSGQIADATPLQSRATDFRDETASDQGANAQFRLTSGEQADVGVAGSGVDQILDENQLLTDINASLEEELQVADIENRDLSERIANLEEQLSVMEALIEVENNEIRAVQEAVTAAAPVVNPITTVTVEEESTVSKILGFLPIVGLVLVGLLAGAYLLIRRRKSGDRAGEIAGFDEEYDENAPIYVEESQKETAVETIEEPVAEIAEPAEEEGSENIAAEAAENEAEDTPENDTAPDALEEELEELTAEPEESAPAEEEEDWASDFDDLDAFFDDVDDTATPEATKPEAEVEVQAEEESDTEKTQMFDSAIHAGTGGPEEGVEETVETEVSTEPGEEEGLDFSLDEEDLGTEDSVQDASSDDEEADEFSVDFDLDEDDLGVADESEVDAVVEETDAEDDENMLAFDMPDTDLSDDSETPTDEDESDLESLLDLDSEEESEVEDSVQDDSENEPDEMDLSDLGFDDDEPAVETEAEEGAEEDTEDDDLDSLLDHFEEQLDSAETETEESEPEEAQLEEAELEEELEEAELEEELEEADLEEAELEEAEPEAAEPETAEPETAEPETAELEETESEEEPEETEVSVEEGETDDIDSDADSDLEIDLESDMDDLSSLLDDDSDESSDESAETDTDEDSQALEDSAEADELLSNFGDDDLDLSDVDETVDVAEECETKLELAAAYIEMGDNSGAKELLEEVVSEGDDSFKARANELLEKIG